MLRQRPIVDGGFGSLALLVLVRTRTLHAQVLACTRRKGLRRLSTEAHNVESRTTCSHPLVTYLPSSYLILPYYLTTFTGSRVLVPYLQCPPESHVYLLDTSNLVKSKARYLLVSIGMNAVWRTTTS